MQDAWFDGQITLLTCANRPLSLIISQLCMAPLIR